MKAFYKNLTSRQLVIYGLLVPTLLTGLICYLLWQGVHDLHQTRDLVRHTRTVQLTLQSFRYNLSATESSQRGYLLTHNDKHLEAYQQNLKTTTEQFGLIRTLTADNPIQQKNLDQIEPIFNEKIQFMEKNTSFETSGNHATAVQNVISDLGRQDMENIMQGVQAMQDVESKLLVERQGIYQSKFEFNNKLAGVLILLCLGFICVTLILLRHMERLQSAVTLCALTEMIEYEDGTITLEEYVRRRHEALIKHGRAQVEAERLLGLLGQIRPKTKPATVNNISSK